jgi:hypothetical protein
MFGDLGSAFMAFEKDLTLLVDDEGEVEEDGYVAKKPYTEVGFKGVIQTPLGVAQFPQNLNLGVNGMKFVGDVVLYLRLGQKGMPILKIGDKIRDTAGLIWKLHSVEEYSNFNVGLYGLSRVD